MRCGFGFGLSWGFSWVEGLVLVGIHAVSAPNPNSRAFFPGFPE